MPDEWEWKRGDKAGEYAHDQDKPAPGQRQGNEDEDVETEGQGDDGSCGALLDEWQPSGTGDRVDDERCAGDDDTGGHGTLVGARAFCALRTYIQTAMKQGVNVLDGLRRLFEGDPWMPAAAGP